MEKYKEMLATIAKTSAEIESTKRSYKELESSITLEAFELDSYYRELINDWLKEEQKNE